MTPAPLRVLCLDIEGGHGGSSRSLYESLHHVDRSRVRPEVWCRRAGPIEERYAELAIPCRVEPALPRLSTVRRFSRNLTTLVHAGQEFRRARPVLRELADEVNRRFDVVHFNHEGFFLIARWLRPRTRAGFSIHIRTTPWDTLFARWQTRTIARLTDHVVFITDEVGARFRAADGSLPGTVIHNIASLPRADVAADARIPADDRFKIACLSNYSWNRGLDRLVEVAAALVAAGRREFLFVMAGDMWLSRSLPGALGAIGRRGGSLADYAAERGLSDSFLFLGHVTEPEGVLVGCQALAKPTREDNPWGRDILEALAHGKPVFSVGSSETFVEHGETGFLRPKFDAEEWARALMGLADDPARYAAMVEKGKVRVRALCDGASRAADLFAVWQAAAREGRPEAGA